MQVEDHAGHRTEDVFTRWLPKYDEMSYQEKVLMCKRAIDVWQVQALKAERRIPKTRSDITRRKHSERAAWCHANVSRWRNSLRECMIAEGVLKRDTVPF